MKLDALFFGAHPDDVELTSGATVAKMTSLGRKVGIVDFTRGEMGTRGTPEIRISEAEEAAKILGVEVRENLELPDSKLYNNEESRTAVIEVIRKYRPRLVVCPHLQDRHPDHSAAASTVHDAVFLSGLEKIDTGRTKHRPDKLFSYMSRYSFVPSFVVDVSDYYDRKMEAVACFKSQFHNPDSSEPETYISSPEFMDRLNARFRYFGALIGSDYGEPFLSLEAVRVNDPLDLLPSEK